MNGSAGRGGKSSTGHFQFGYSDFIKGPIWKAFREQYFTRHAKVCRVCNSPLKVELNHLKHSAYMVLKDELFVALCQPHHRQLTSEYAKVRGRPGVDQMTWSLAWVQIQRNRRRK